MPSPASPASSVASESSLEATPNGNGDASDGSEGQDSHRPEVRLPKPLTEEARGKLENRTMNLMRKRERLNKKLTKIIKKTAVTTTLQDAISRAKTLKRMERLARRERRHLIARAALLKQRYTLYRWDPTDERAIDLELARSLLKKFSRHVRYHLNDPKIVSSITAEEDQRENKNTPESEHSDSEGDDNNLRYDQQRVKEMLSGVTYDDLVYDAEPLEGRRVIDHDLWVSGALNDSPQSPEVTSQNGVDNTKKPHESTSTTTPAKSAIKKNEGSKSSTAARKVTFQEVLDQDFKKATNGDQFSSPTYKYSLNQSGKHSASTDTKQTPTKRSKKAKSHTKGGTLASQPSTPSQEL